MAETNNINANYTGDINQFYLQRAGSSRNDGVGGGPVAERNYDDIVVYGNPSAGYPFDWLEFLYLPAPFFPFDNYDPEFPVTTGLAYQEFVDFYPQVTTLLSSKPPTDNISINMLDSHGQTINVALNIGDLQNMFANFKYNVVSNMDLTPGYGGFTKCEGGSCFSNIDSKTLAGYYSAWLSDGLVYYMFHEIAHNLPTVKDYELAEGGKYITVDEHATYDGGYASSVYFNNIEAMANTVAKSIADYLGLGMEVHNVPHGFLPAP